MPIEMKALPLCQLCFKYVAITNWWAGVEFVEDANRFESNLNKMLNFSDFSVNSLFLVSLFFQYTCCFFGVNVAIAIRNTDYSEWYIAILRFL